MYGNTNLGYRNEASTKCHRLNPTRETLTEYCNSEVGALMIILMFSLKSTRKRFLWSTISVVVTCAAVVLSLHVFQPWKAFRHWKVAPCPHSENLKPDSRNGSTMWRWERWLPAFLCLFPILWMLLTEYYQVCPCVRRLVSRIFQDPCAENRDELSKLIQTKNTEMKHVMNTGMPSA